MPMIFGSSLHFAVSEFASSIIENPRMLHRDFKSLQQLGIAAFEIDFDKNVKNLRVSEDDVQKKRAEGIKIMKNYAMRERHTTFAPYEDDEEEVIFGGFEEEHVELLRKPWLVEEKFSLATGLTVHGNNIRFNGIFDRIDEEFSTIDDSGDVYRVLIEYKTQLRAYAIDKYTLQVKFYTWAYNQMHNDVPLRHSYISSITTGEMRMLELDAKTTELEVKAIMADTATSIAEKKFDPNPSWVNCNFCSFADVCPASAIKKAKV
jgi:CRISPR/Cas system-associated exonuclease Cas4 (RecB family)